VTNPSHADIYSRIGTIEGLHAAMDEKLDRIIKSQEAMRDELAEVKKTADATKDVVKAWDTARNVGTFVKWLAGIIGAITAIVVAFKVAAGHLLR